MFSNVEEMMWVSPSEMNWFSLSPKILNRVGNELTVPDGGTAAAELALLMKP